MLIYHLHLRFSTVIDNIEEIFTQTLQNQQRIITILESLGVDFIQVLSKYKRASIVVQNYEIQTVLIQFLIAPSSLAQPSFGATPNFATERNPKGTFYILLMSLW